MAHNRVTARDKREVTTANFVVRYSAKQTNGQIDGLVACELSARTYGASQWWVLLQHSTQGQDSAIGAPWNGEMAAVDISLLSSPVSTVRQNAVNLSRVHSAVAHTPGADLTAWHPFPLH